MKKLLKLLVLGGIIAVITTILRDQLLPSPETPQAHPPAFRSPPAPPPRPASPSPESADDLTRVNGIGPVYAGRLAGAGIHTFGDLAAADADELASHAGLPRQRVAGWIAAAADLA